MRTAPALALSRSERQELERWIGEEPLSARQRGRARIVLAAAEGRTNSEIATRVGAHPATVARWRTRFLLTGVDALRREAPRAGNAAKVSGAMIERVLRRTLNGQPPDGQPWTTRTMARSLRTNHMLVHRVWTAYRLTRTPPSGSARSPRTAPRVDVVGMFVTSRASAIVFSTQDRPVGTSRPPSQPRATIPDFSGPQASGSGPLSQMLELVRRTESSGAVSGASREATSPLLVFLRGVEARCAAGARIDVIFDRPLVKLNPRLLRWLAIHARFRAYPTTSGERWSHAVRSWLARWEPAGADPGSFRNVPDCVSRLARAAASGNPRDRHTGWMLSPAGRGQRRRTNR